MRNEEMFHFANVDEYGDDYYDPCYDWRQDEADAAGVPSSGR